MQVVVILHNLDLGSGSLLIFRLPAQFGVSCACALFRRARTQPFLTSSISRWDFGSDNSLNHDIWMWCPRPFLWLCCSQCWTSQKVEAGGKFLGWSSRTVFSNLQVYIWQTAQFYTFHINKQWISVDFVCRFRVAYRITAGHCSWPGTTWVQPSLFHRVFSKHRSGVVTQQSTHWLDDKALELHLYVIKITVHMLVRHCCVPHWCDSLHHLSATTPPWSPA